MRKKLFELSETLKIPLLHCDMFPYSGEQTINLGLGESNAINTATGMSYYSPVFLYGVCGFLLHRFEQLKLNAKNAGKIILFNAGGSNFDCYKDFGIGHTCCEDLELAKALKIPVYTPDYENFEETVSEILLNTEGLSLVRLGSDTRV